MARRGRPPKNTQVEAEPEVVETEEEVTEPEEVEPVSDEDRTSAPLATKDALIKRRYRIGVVTTSQKRSFEIKSIDPKTLLITRGTAFLPAFNDFLAEPNPESLANPEIIDFVSDIVIQSVTSLNFVKKPIDECSDEEVPIETIDIDERIEIFSAVMELCASEEEKIEWRFFPGVIAEVSDDIEDTTGN